VRRILALLQERMLRLSVSGFTKLSVTSLFWQGLSEECKTLCNWIDSFDISGFHLEPEGEGKEAEQFLGEDWLGGTTFITGKQRLTGVKFYRQCPLVLVVK